MIALGPDSPAQASEFARDLGLSFPVVSDEGLRKSLLSKAERAISHAKNDNAEAAKSELKALIEDVKAQRGETLTPDEADLLILYVLPVGWFFSMNSIIMPAISLPVAASIPSSPGEELTSMTTGP